VKNLDFSWIFELLSSRCLYKHLEFQKVVKQKWFVITTRNFLHSGLSKFEKNPKTIHPKKITEAYEVVVLGISRTQKFKKP
jgi:hypothetical protein